jgi:hypothetical protein
VAAINSRPSYYFIHGFVGGRGHSRILRKYLKAKGYSEAKAPDAADIIIGHSAGCLMINPKTKAGLIVLVGAALPQTDTNKTFKTANMVNWQTAVRNHYLLRRIYWYLLSMGMMMARPKRNISIVRTIKAGTDIPSYTQAKQVVFIANKDDPWPHSPRLNSLMDETPWAFLSLEGSHENIWEHPDYYADIIEAYAKRLLA